MRNCAIMDVTSTVAQARLIQNALRVLAVLQLTAILWPPQSNVENGDEHDFIVVGAGSAGSVIANRLTEGNFRVMLIEAGGDPPLESIMPGLMLYIQNSRLDWNFTNQYTPDIEKYQKNRTFFLPSGKMLGGGSSANFMYYLRGHPHDFDAWAEAAGDESWKYENILKYFIKSEKLKDDEVLKSANRMFHGTEGYLEVTKEHNPIRNKYLRMFNELGHKIRIDLNGNDTLGYAEPMYTISDGIRQSTAYSFLGTVKERPHLHVLKNTLVTKILFDETNNAIGVKVRLENGKVIKLMAKKEVIISAGVFNSPKLLMLSGVGPKEHLESLNIKVIADSPVGENLHDHVPVIAAFKMQKSNKVEPPPNYSTHGAPVIVGFVAVNKTKGHPNYETVTIIDSYSSKGLMEICALNAMLDPYVCQRLYEAGQGRELLLSIVNLLNPKSRGKYQLRSKNPNDPPLIDVGYLSHPDDIEAIATYLEDYARITKTSFFKKVKGEFVDLGLPECRGLEMGSKYYWACHALSARFTFSHYCCTCSLGTVLDERLRVQGVNRLRVVDGSAMPRLTSGHNNAPIIMMAEKAADMIKEDNCM